ncbi:Heat shock 70 kDa protein 4L, partial [Bienertia sinuspersici]
MMLCDLHFLKNGEQEERAEFSQQLMEGKMQTLEKKLANIQEKELRQPFLKSGLNNYHRATHLLLPIFLVHRISTGMKPEIDLSTTQREKALGKQIHCLTEQLAAKNKPLSKKWFECPINLTYHSSDHNIGKGSGLLRSAFVLYVFLLHIIVLIRISFESGVSKEFCIENE